MKESVENGFFFNIKKTNSPTQHQRPLQCSIVLVCSCYYNKLCEKVNRKVDPVWCQLHCTRYERWVNMKAARAHCIGNFLCHSEHKELGERTRGKVFSSVWMWRCMPAIPACGRWRQREENQELKVSLSYMVN